MAEAGKRPRARRAAIAAATAIAALALAGCGGDDESESGSSDSADQEAAVTEAVTTFNEALDAKDAASACAVLSPEGQEDVQSFTGEKTCEDAISGYDIGEKPGFYSDREVRVVSVDGTTAKAESVTDDGPIDVPLEQVDGTWLITDPPL